MASFCPELVNFCHMRVARLDSDGSRLVGANNRYETNAGVEMAASPIVKEAQRFEQLNGCGNLCAVYDADCDRVTGWTLNLQVCEDDYSFQEILAGGTLFSEGDNVVGYADPDPLASCYYGVVIEAWSVAWDGDEQLLIGGSPAWDVYLYPKVLWRAGDVTQALGINVINFVGRAIPNINAGLGPTCDWPGLVPGPRGKRLTTDPPPGANCGQLPLIACSS